MISCHQLTYPAITITARFRYHSLGFGCGLGLFSSVDEFGVCPTAPSGTSFTMAAN